MELSSSTSTEITSLSTEEWIMSESEYAALERFLRERDEELDAINMSTDEFHPLPYPNGQDIFWIRRSNDY